MLSAREQRLLEEIEDALVAGDPAWAAQFGAAPGAPVRPGPRPRPRSRSRIRWALLCALVGLLWAALLTAGIALHSLPTVTAAVTLVAVAPAVAFLLLCHLVH